jgi:hypothetical protein
MALPVYSEDTACLCHRNQELRSDIYPETTVQKAVGWVVCAGG